MCECDTMPGAALRSQDSSAALFRRARHAANRVVGKDAMKTCVALNDWAVLLKYAPRFNRAARLYRCVMKLVTSARGPEPGYYRDAEQIGWRPSTAPVRRGARAHRTRVRAGPSASRKHAAIICELD